MRIDHYEIEPRPSELGGGCRLKLFRSGEEVGGGIFPVCADYPDEKMAYAAALEEAESHLALKRSEEC